MAQITCLDLFLEKVSLVKKQDYAAVLKPIWQGKEQVPRTHRFCHEKRGVWKSTEEARRQRLKTQVISHHFEFAISEKSSIASTCQINNSCPDLLRA
jgi:hypothetical protein